MYENILLAICGIIFLALYQLEDGQKEYILKLVWLGLGLAMIASALFVNYNLTNTTTIIQYPEHNVTIANVPLNCVTTLTLLPLTNCGTTTEFEEFEEYNVTTTTNNTYSLNQSTAYIGNAFDLVILAIIFILSYRFIRLVMRSIFKK